MMDTLICRSISGLGATKGLELGGKSLYSYLANSNTHFIGGIRGPHRGVGVGNSAIYDLRIHRDHFHKIVEIRDKVRRSLLQATRVSKDDRVAVPSGFFDFELLAGILNDIFIPNPNAKLAVFKSRQGGLATSHRHRMNLMALNEGGVADRMKCHYIV